MLTWIIDVFTNMHWGAVGQIIMIDILLGGDNAVVIALACRNLPKDQRSKGVFWGTAGDIILRVILITFAVLLNLPFLKVVGGCLLLWIGYKLILPDDDSEEEHIKGNTKLFSAIKTIIVADMVMSIDNVHHKVKLTSIMRDVRVYMGDGSPYDSGYDKLNHAYMYGGPEQAIRTIKEHNIFVYCADLGGAPLALTYKAINTMDSMLGYKNEKYLYFGRIPAKLDDAANYLPSRLAALLWVAAAAFTHNDAKGAWKIWRRDRRNHASPNSAQTESACAGALGVQLAGPAYYFGEYYAKPTIGDPLRPIEPEDILRANRMMYVASAFALAWGVAIRAVL